MRLLNIAIRQNKNQLVKKVPARTFLTALSAAHFEGVQNAVAESLDISRLSTAVYPI